MLFHRIWQAQWVFLCAFGGLFIAMCLKESLITPIALSVCVASLFGFLVCFFTTLDPEVAPANTAQFNQSGEFIRTYKKKTQVSDKTWRDNSFISLGACMTTKMMTVRPITPNPKVREITYKVTVRTPMVVPILAASIRKIWRSKGTVQDNLDAFVRQQCYDFNEQHSVELGALYNPLDEKQQATFRQLLATFLTPRLAEANLTFADATFSC